MKEDIVILGSGGHAKSVIDCLLNQQKYNIAAILGCEADVGKKICGLTVSGTDEDIKDYIAHGISKSFIAIGSVESFALRARLYDWIKGLGLSLVNVIDDSSVIAKTVRLGEGVFIGKGVVVNTDAEISDMVILNTGCIIEHDCSVGRFTHIAPGTVLCGCASVGESTFVGANTTVLHCKGIGRNSIVGAGSVVTKDVGDGCKAYGNPCKEMERY